MSWLSWLVQFIKRFLPEEKDARTLIAQSPNQRSQLYYEVEAHPGAICTFYLCNPTDSQGDITLYFDEIAALYQEFRRQKMTRSISVRDSELEKQLVQSKDLGCNYRLTVIRSWYVQGRNGEKRVMKELKYVLDFNWGIQNHYDSPYRSFRSFASSFLKEELPSHRVDWGKFICDPYAINWKERLESLANAKDVRVVFPGSAIRRVVC
jgi:hypothetical protein